MSFWDLIYEVYKENKWSVSVLVCVIGATLALLLLSKVFEAVKEYFIERKKVKYSSELEKQRSYQESILELQKMYVNGTLEVQLIKINRVLPVFEEISKDIHRYIVMTNSYFRYISLKGDFSRDEKYEKERVALDVRFLENVSKIAMYLPKEMNIVLFKIRVLMSLSWKTYTQFGNMTGDFSKEDVVKKCKEILGCYKNCVHDMFLQYSKLSECKNNWNEILNNNNINERGEYITKEELSKVSYAFLLTDAV